MELIMKDEHFEDSSIWSKSDVSVKGNELLFNCDFVQAVKLEITYYVCTCKKNYCLLKSIHQISVLEPPQNFLNNDSSITQQRQFLISMSYFLIFMYNFLNKLLTSMTITNSFFGFTHDHEIEPLNIRYRQKNMLCSLLSMLHIDYVDMSPKKE
ncbi:hypothetical protein V1478_017771 [Vespula squamosa]|uniref:Uncharacterized protein n=1 Tax=Vespula squamosa TaxID=30214 RepID=A0ABD1ZWS1_VESSQ